MKVIKTYMIDLLHQVHILRHAVQPTDLQHFLNVLGTPDVHTGFTMPMMKEIVTRFPELAARVIARM